MTDYKAPWFSAAQFMPHGHSWLWSPGVLWMSVISDLLIALACLAIPLMLIYTTRSRRDLRFNGLVLCFSVFAIACGVTYVMDAWNVWHVQYWLEAVTKVIAAAASMVAAIMLWRALPALRSRPSQKQLRLANESLARANRELEAFTASVSHDLRSPLTTIAGQAGLLELSLGAQGTDDQRRRLHRIESSVKQMSELIDALLALSRISRHTLHRETVDVSLLSDLVIADLRQQQPDRVVQITVQPGIQVYGDRRLLADMLTNLIGNSWKFTGKTPAAHIEIGEATHGSMAKLFIRDNGVGFDMAFKQKLFKPFQRLHAPGEFEGSGVGLATVARIIERHGGEIQADAAPNKGAVFYFTLPTAPITDEILVTREPKEALGARP
jgi:signal transduction histidine kinase